MATHIFNCEQQAWQPDWSPSVETACISRFIIVCSFHPTLCQSRLLHSLHHFSPYPHYDKPLTGSDNYESWPSQLSLVLFAIGAKDLVISGVKPDSDDMTSECEHQLLQQALLIIIQLVSEPLLAQISNLSTAHEMWVYLRENYFSDTFQFCPPNAGHFFIKKLLATLSASLKPNGPAFTSLHLLTAIYLKNRLPHAALTAPTTPYRAPSHQSHIFNPLESSAIHI